MLRDQIINFLQAVVVFLLLTNALSVLLAAWAIRIASGARHNTPALMQAAQRKLGAMLYGASWRM